MITLFGGNKDIYLKFWTFPGGERNVKIGDPEEINRFRSFTINCSFKNSDDLIDILLLVNAIRNVNRNVQLRLCIPYFPFARQDRVMSPGEPLALQVVINIIKSCKFNEIEVWDPHSDTLAGMFEPGELVVKTQDSFWLEYFKINNKTILVSPDAGAAKKIYKLAGKVQLPVLECSKNRNVLTGEITGVTVPNISLVTKYKNFAIVDDICDGGKTFIELAKELRKVYGQDIHIVLCVTHGIFSKGKDIILNEIDCIYCINELGDNNNV